MVRSRVPRCRYRVGVVLERASGGWRLKSKAQMWHDTAVVTIGHGHGHSGRVQAGRQLRGVWIWDVWGQTGLCLGVSHPAPLFSSTSRARRWSPSFWKAWCERKACKSSNRNRYITAELKSINILYTVPERYRARLIPWQS